MNVATFRLFAICSARAPASYLNRRCSCGLTHGPALRGYVHTLGRMATYDEFRAYCQHRRGLEATTPDRVVGRRQREKDGRHNGPRGEGGRVFQAPRWGNAVGQAKVNEPDRRRR